MTASPCIVLPAPVTSVGVFCSDMRLWGPCACEVLVWAMALSMCGLYHRYICISDVNWHFLGTPVSSLPFSRLYSEFELPLPTTHSGSFNTNLEPDDSSESITMASGYGMHGGLLPKESQK